MEILKQILNEEQFNNIIKLRIDPWVTYQSIIVRKNNIENPIYIIHSNLPSIIELNDEDEILDSNYGEDYIIGSYETTKIIFNDIIFSDLQTVEILGDVLMFTVNGLFELTNVRLEDETLIYDDVVYLGLN